MLLGLVEEHTITMQPIEAPGWLMGRNKRTSRPTGVPRPLIGTDPGSWTRLNSSRRPLTHPPGISRGTGRLLRRLRGNAAQGRKGATQGRTRAQRKRTVLGLGLILGLGRARGLGYSGP